MADDEERDGNTPPVVPAVPASQPAFTAAWLESVVRTAVAKRAEALTECARVGHDWHHPKGTKGVHVLVCRRCKLVWWEKDGVPVPWPVEDVAEGEAEGEASES